MDCYTYSLFFSAHLAFLFVKHHHSRDKLESNALHGCFSVLPCNNSQESCNNHTWNKCHRLLVALEPHVVSYKLQLHTDATV